MAAKAELGPRRLGGDEEHGTRPDTVGGGLIAVLRLAKLTDAEYVLGQVAAGLDEYYLGSGEAPGVWSGRLAAELGLVGVVEAAGLRALIDGRHPGSGERLCGTKRPTVRAIDATFSAPKSVSLLWAFGSPEVAAAVSIAHVEAVEAALAFAESRAAVTRRQRGGVRVRAGTSGWAAATFVHRTSRTGDPQIHTHCVIANVVQRYDGAWVALDAAALYRWAKAAGSVYQEELRRRVSERLGVGWGPDRNGCREMTGITESQLRAFSKRTVQIEAHLAATGTAELVDRKARMQADEAASIATRPRKDRTLSPERLRQRWDTEAEQSGLATGEALLDAVRAPPSADHVGLAEMRELFARLVDPEMGLCAHDSRFGEAQVIEAIAAWGAGRLTVGDIEALTRAFLDSDRVVRLVNRDPSGRASGQWSTVAHRQVEDRVLKHLAVVQARETVPLRPPAVDHAICNAARLGDDQAAAVRALWAAGPALRALIAPPGHGKTTTLATAVDAARRAGRPILAVSTTNQAVDQLRQVGIEARTVARFAIDDPVLEAGTAVIVDEFSQLPTHEAEVVLAAVAACPGGQVWMVGDPLQAQPVRAGGLAPWLAEQIRQGTIAVAELTVNRRQADPVERDALTRFRDGQVVASQGIRDGAGWEHHHPDRDHAVAAMTAAVLADLDTHGPERVAALAVTHVDCEAVADRIRAERAEHGAIGGPSLEGPGWAGPRPYQAGDRILLHAHARLDNGARLTNGTVATVVAVTAAGLQVRADGAARVVELPAGFVTARAPDGRPQISHAWCRTVDGVQGGTWDQVHLLATPAVDYFRGYVGQSRSIQPTHTWNTTPNPAVDVGDHGGRVVESQATPAEQVAAALSRAQQKTFAAGDDPYRIDRAIRAEQAAQRYNLERRAPDAARRVAEAEAVIARRQADVAEYQARLQHWQERHQATVGIHGDPPPPRREPRAAPRQVAMVAPTVTAAEQRLDDARHDHRDLVAQQAARFAFDQSNRWRVERIEQLRAQLEQHWMAAVVSAARDGHPGAYGEVHLRAAREHLVRLMLTPSAPSPAGVGDPELALQDVHRAIDGTATVPASRLVERLWAEHTARLDIRVMQQHAMQAGYSAQPAPPTPTIEM